MQGEITEECSSTGKRRVGLKGDRAEMGSAAPQPPQHGGK